MCIIRRNKIYEKLGDPSVNHRYDDGNGGFTPYKFYCVDLFFHSLEITDDNNTTNPERSRYLVREDFIEKLKSRINSYNSQEDIITPFKMVTRRKEIKFRIRSNFPIENDFEASSVVLKLLYIGDNEYFTDVIFRDEDIPVFE